MPRGRAAVLAALALVLVLIVKVAIGAAVGAHPLLAPEGELDGAYYRHFAERVLAGDPWLLRADSFFGQPAAPFFIAPLYIYALALFLAVGGSLEAVRVIQLALGTAGVVLIALTARRWFGDRAAWIAGALAAGCGLFTFYESLILQAAIEPVLSALDLYLLTRAIQDGRRRDWAAAGAALGLHALNRPNVVMLIAGLALILLKFEVRSSKFEGGSGFAARFSSRFAAAAVFLIAAAVVMAPATVRNYRVSGEFIPISSHGGLNFLIGNGPEADGTFVSAMGVPPTIRGQWIDAPAIAAAAAGRPLGPSGTSAFFRDQALGWIAEHPHAEARLLARKSWYALSGIFLTLNHSFPFYAHDAGGGLRWLAVGPLVMLPLGLIGIIFARPRGGGFWVWAAYIPLSLLSVIAFFVAARYRLPFQVALVVAAGGGASWAIDAIRSRRWRAMALAALLAAAALALVAWPTGLDDGRAEEQARMGLYELERNRVDDAERWIARAVERHGFPGVVHLRAGQAHESAGRFDAALGHYRRAVAIDPEEGALRLAMARVLTSLNQPDAALDELKRVAPDVRPTAAAREYERVGLLFITSGRAADGVEVLGQAARLNPKAPSIFLNRAVALAMLGRTADARADAEAALKLDPNYTRAADLLRTLRR